MKLILFISLINLSTLVNAQSISKDSIRTTTDMIDSVKEALKQIKLKFKDSATNDDILFGLQHTMGMKFKETLGNFLKISDYYNNLTSEISKNKADTEGTVEFIRVLSDLTVNSEEKKYLAKKIVQIQDKYPEDAKTSKATITSESIKDSTQEVDKDPRIQKDPDGRNEVIMVMEADGSHKTLAKQYLASLLEPFQ